MKTLRILPFLLILSISLAAQQNANPFPYISQVSKAIKEMPVQEQTPAFWHELMQSHKTLKSDLAVNDRFPGIKKQVLDSVNFYTYFENSASLQLTEKQAFYFDDKGNLLTAIISQLNENIDPIMTPLLRMDFVYNRKNQLVCETWSFPNTTLTWDHFYRAEYMYEKGNICEEIEYYFNDISQNWNNSWKSQYSYFGPGMPAKEISYYWGLEYGSWELDMKYEYSYFNNNKLWKEKVYHYDSYYNQWDFIWFFESVYGANGLLAEYKYVSVDPENNNNLFTCWKYLYDYYANGERKEMAYKEWNEEQFEFQFKWKENYGYDAMNNLSFMTEFIMNPDGSAWIPSYSMHCWYDTDYSGESLLLPFILIEDEQTAFMFRSKLTNVLQYSWNEMNGSWMNDGMVQLFYSEQSVTGTEAYLQDMHIYPNPADELLYIEGPGDQKYGYTLTDLMGNTLKMAENLIDRQRILLSDMPEGSYVLVLSDASGHMKSVKIMVQHK